MNRSPPVEARWMRAWVLDTVGSAMASAAAEPSVGNGVGLGRRPMMSVS